MFQALPKSITFEEFLEWKPDGGGYELYDGAIVEMQPLGEHEETIGFLVRKLNVEFERLDLPYFVPKQAMIKAPDRESGYLPDVLILNRPALQEELMWKKYSTIQKGTSVPLVIEVVSTNWRDDYLVKAADYEKIGIPEYWIVDYLGLGGRRFIGNPKRPTISIYHLIEGEYQVSQFRDSNRLESPTFPELNLTAQQIFQASSN